MFYQQTPISYPCTCLTFESSLNTNSAKYSLEAVFYSNIILADKYKKAVLSKVEVDEWMLVKKYTRDTVVIITGVGVSIIQNMIGYVATAFMHDIRY